MKKRTFDLVVLATLVVVCLCAAVMLTACNKESTYYLSIASNNWPTFEKGDSVASSVRFTANADGTFSLVIELVSGDSFAVYKVGSTNRVVDSISSVGAELTIGVGGKVFVRATGKYVLTIDVDSGKLSYRYTATTTDPVPVTGIALSKTSLNMTVGDDENITVTVIPSNADEQGWSYDVDGNENGVVTETVIGNVITVHAEKAGTVKLVVTSDYNGNVAASCQITVSDSVVTLNAIQLSVQDNGGSATLQEIGATLQLSVITDPANYQWSWEDINWANENPSVATVDQYGKVTAVADGVTEITATLGGKDAKITVTVHQVLPSIDVLDYTIVELGTSTTVEISYPFAVSKITATSATAAIVTATASASDKTVTLTSTGFGRTTVAVSVAYAAGTATFTLNVGVVSDYFYLTGTVDGGNFDIQSSKSSAASANLLLAETSSGSGIYTLTRSFAANEKFYVAPARLDTNRNYAVTKFYYSSEKSDVHCLDSASDTDSVIVSYAGNYTVTLDVTGEKASWYVTVNYVVATGASIAADQTTLVQDDTTVANLTLTVHPQGLVEIGSIIWSLPEQYNDWLILVPSQDGLSCVATFVYVDEGVTQARVTVIATVATTGGTVTATCEIELVARKPLPTPTTNVTWEEDDVKVDVCNGWTVTLSAVGDGDVSGVTYMLVTGNGSTTQLTDVYVNDDGSTVAFAIDSESGRLSALMFGTVWVMATSKGVDSDGNNVYSWASVTFYASSFKLQMGLDDAVCYDHEADNTATYYEWSEIELTADTAIIFTYGSVSSDGTSIRSVGYLHSSSTCASGTSGANGHFSVIQTGVYNVTLDLSGVKPSVKFEYVREMAPTTFKLAIYVVDGDVGSNWTMKDVYGSTEVTINPATDDLTLTIRDVEIETMWPTIAFVVVINDVEQRLYAENVSQSEVAISGNEYDANGSDYSGVWNGNNGNCRLYYGGSSVSQTYVFTFTFDVHGVLTAIQID